MAILLHEEGLYDRARIYATDINEAVLQRARQGIFPLEPHAGVHGELPARRRHARLLRVLHGRVRRRALRSPRCSSNIVFSQHNLATDRLFNEFNVILCRNVLIYFDRTLQDRVHGLFYDSLAHARRARRWAARSRCASREYERLLRAAAGAAEKLYRKVR